MMLRVGVNGAGRIGRSLVRLAEERPELAVVAINDIGDTDSIAHLLRHDSVHGSFRGTVRSLGDELTLNGNVVRVMHGQTPEEIAWGALDVDVVVEATGRFVLGAEARRHLGQGVKRVIVSAVSPGADRMIVLGLHDGLVEPHERVISNASCTTHAAALPLSLLHRFYGVIAADMTTVHCTTGSQVTIDMPHKDKRRARAASLSMIPTSTTASHGLALALPELRGKLSCLAVRVPTAAVSMVEIVAHTERSVDTPAVLVERFRTETKGALGRYLGICEEPLVSVDFKGDPRSSIIDAELIECPGKNLVRVIAWYDNEWGYANRLADLLSLWALHG